MDEELIRQTEHNWYLKQYVEELSRATSKLPRYYETLTIRDLAEIRKEAQNDPKACNFIYKVGSSFIHINANKNQYASIEKQLDDMEKEKLRAIKQSILTRASGEDSSETKEDLERILGKLYRPGGRGSGGRGGRQHPEEAPEAPRSSPQASGSG